MKNLYLFYGEETYLLQQKVNYWKKNFKERQGEYNLSVIDGIKEETGKIITECESMPFLGEKRLIIIENLPSSTGQKISDEKTKTLLSFLENIPETSVILFFNSIPDKRTKFYKYLIEHAEVEEFPVLVEKKLYNWINQEVQRQKGVILPGAVPYLVQKTGNNLWSIQNEINKLIAFNDGKAISENDIDKLVTPIYEVNIFKLTDYIGLKKTKSALDILSKLVESDFECVYIYNMIVRQFRIFLQIFDLKNKPQKEIATLVGLHPFVVENSLKQINLFTKKELESAYSDLLKIDIKLKTGQIKMSISNSNIFLLELEKFIIKFSQKT